MITFFYDSCEMFFKFFVPGIFSGMIYDIFRLNRIKRNFHSSSFTDIVKKRYFSEKTVSPVKKHNFDNILIFMEDVCFFLIAAIAEVLAIYYLNDGEIRIYCLLFSVIGFFCYQKTIGFVIIFFAKKLLCWFRKIICFFVFLILDPIVFITRKIGKIFSSIIQK